jgi:hypothetical protein
MQTPAGRFPVLKRSGMIGVSLIVFDREPHLDDFRTSTGGFGGGPGSKYARLPGSTMIPLLDIFCLFERRFSLQRRKPRIPITNAPRGIPIASPTAVAVLKGVDDLLGSLSSRISWSRP